MSDSQVGPSAHLLFSLGRGGPAFQARQHRARERSELAGEGVGSRPGSDTRLLCDLVSVITAPGPAFLSGDLSVGSSGSLAWRVPNLDHLQHHPKSSLKRFLDPITHARGRVRGSVPLENSKVDSGPQARSETIQ